MSERTISINDEVIKRLKHWIVIQENINLKTKVLNDAQMVAKIKKHIEEEIECYSNQSN